MDEEQRRTMMQETFNAVSGGYDSKALRFFPESANYLADVLGLRGDEQVLDVATGTGHAALSVAPRLQRGRVTGVDFSSGMLEQARKKAAAMNIGNVDFVEMDMQALTFPTGRFDAAICAFGIFFVEDMDTQLAHIAAAVKPGGTVAISGFQENFFHPLVDMMYGVLERYGIQKPPQTWRRIATEEGCRELFKKAGISKVRVEKKNVGYHLDSAEEWWDVIWNAGFRRLVNQLSPRDRDAFKGEHLQEVDALRTTDGIWLDVGVLYAIGTKP